MLADGQLFFVVRTRGTTGRSGSDTGGTSLVLEQKHGAASKLEERDGSRCHGRFRTWREQTVAQCNGFAWTTVAQDRMTWRGKLEAMTQ